MGLSSTGARELCFRYAPDGFEELDEGNGLEFVSLVLLHGHFTHADGVEALLLGDAYCFVE